MDTTGKRIKGTGRAEGEKMNRVHHKKSGLCYPHMLHKNDGFF